MSKYKDIAKILKANGFKKIRNGKGSHEIWDHPCGIKTTLPNHGSKEVSKIVERSILKAIKLTK